MWRLVFALLMVAASLSAIDARWWCTEEEKEDCTHKPMAHHCKDNIRQRLEGQCCMSCGNAEGEWCGGEFGLCAPHLKCVSTGDHRKPGKCIKYTVRIG